MSMYCSIINPNDIDKYWDDVKPFLLKALEHEHGDLTVGLIYKYLKEEYFLLILIIELIEDSKTIIAVQTVELRKTDLGKLCNLVTTSGTRLNDWQDLLSATIDMVAKEEKCYAIHTRGRLGWLKQLKRNGYKPLYFIAEKRLEE